MVEVTVRLIMWMGGWIDWEEGREDVKEREETIGGEGGEDGMIDETMKDVNNN